jgi:hypothetical protein
MDDSINRALVFGSQLLALILVFTGAILQESQLQSARPTEAGGQIASDTTGPYSDRFARNWDDPLELFQTFTPVPLAATPASSPPPPETPENVARQSIESNNADPAKGKLLQDAVPTIGRSFKVSSESSVLILWNIIDARPLPEAREARLRSRYAISTVLAASGYQENKKSTLLGLGYQKQDNPERSAVFEIFKRASSAASDNYPDQVWVAWHPEQSKTLLQDYDEIIKAFSSRFTTENKKELINTKISVTIFHHGNSDTFRNFLENEKPLQDKDRENDKLKILFVRATLPDAVLNEVSRTVAVPFRGVTSDDTMASMLVEELRLRIPAMSSTKKEGRIVIFTESDTSYGGNLVSCLKKHIQSSGSQPKVSIEVYTYLKGLDGRAGEQATTSGSSSPKSQNPKNVPGKSGGSSDRSWGTSQYDYLRRSATSLKGSTATGEPILAVGVLGSDIYDKLLVLQALHSEMQSVPYFTTDLDSLYLQSEHLPFTRNLIIATGAVLDGRTDNTDSVLWKVPPMRDSYQESIADQVAAAITGKVLDPKPEICEVGAGRLVILSKGNGSNPGGVFLAIIASPITNIAIFFLGLANALFILAAISTRPLPTDDNRTGLDRGAKKFLQIEAAVSGTVGFILAMLLLASVLPKPEVLAWISAVGAVGALLGILYSLWNRYKKDSKNSKHDRPTGLADITAGGITLAGITISLAVVAVFLFLHPYLELLGEPLSITSGVSIWPSVVLRVGAFLVGLLLLLFTFRDFSKQAFQAREELRRITKPYKPSNPAESSGDGVIRALDRFVVNLMRPVWTCLPFKPSFTAAPTEGTFLSCMSNCFNPVRRFYRVAFASMVYLVFSIILFKLWPPTVPARGGEAFLIEKITLSAGVGLYIVHLCFCVELHLCSFIAIRRFTQAVMNQTKTNRKVRLSRKSNIVVSDESIAESDTSLGKGLTSDDLTTMARCVGVLTKIVGFTLLYPLTILSLLILSRLRLFDAWAMTPSLAITFGCGGAILVAVSIMMLATSRTFRAAIEKEAGLILNDLESAESRAIYSFAETEKKRQILKVNFDLAAAKREREWIIAYRNGSFAPWYQQPIFTAILVGLALLGSLGVAEPLVKMLVR